MTKSAPIPFVNNQESGWDELAGASPISVNIVVDGKGTVRRRPGIEAYSEAPSTAIDADGIYALNATENGKLYAFGGGKQLNDVYLIAGGSALKITSSATPVTGAMGARPIVAETEALLVVAAGAYVHKINLVTNTVARLGGGPPRASHVAATAGRLLVNNVATDRSRAYFSAPALGTSILGHEQWTAGKTALGTSGSFGAEARPDSILAILENTNEAFVWGRSTMQSFAPDESFIFAPVVTREFGLSSVYSIIRDDMAFAWIDDKRRIVHSDGRTFDVLSDPIKRTLDDIDDITDCFGYRLVHGPIDALCWCFPSDGRTLVYQRKAGWSQWMGWDVAQGNWKRFAVNTVVLRNNDNIVGLNSGIIGKMRTGVNTDLGDPIKASVRTGFISHGTDSRKLCLSTRFVLRRGTSTNAEEPYAFLRWRDDLGDFGRPIRIGLGRTGDTEAIVERRSLGMYRRRQWEFEFAGSEEIVLVSATEEFRVLGN